MDTITQSKTPSRIERYLAILDPSDLKLRVETLVKEIRACDENLAVLDAQRREHLQERSHAAVLLADVLAHLGINKHIHDLLNVPEHEQSRHDAWADDDIPI